MATPKKIEEKNQSVEPVKAEATAADDVLVTVPVTLLNGNEIELKMFRDPMDASDEVLEHAELGNFVAYTRGLITPESKFEMRAKKSCGRDLIETILPAYQEATGQGED
nr:MAG TPA_asm: hypothetical protein [Caudoviricetes sp.]